VDFEVGINEEVLIPLESAMKFSPLVARRKDEVRAIVCQHSVVAAVHSDSATAVKCAV
jgi:hypothetical protein